MGTIFESARVASPWNFHYNEGVSAMLHAVICYQLIADRITATKQIILPPF